MDKLCAVPLENRTGDNVQKVYVETLIKLAEDSERIVVLDADLASASGTIPFLEKFPERHFQIGIAEQNMVGIAAGLALSGKIPFVNSFGTFLSKRACDQISVSVCFNKTNVKICGHRAGLTNAHNGATHIAVEDIAIMRATPNMTVVSPGDTIEIREVIKWAADFEGPVYICLPHSPLFQIFDENYKFKLGRGIQIARGNEVAIISTGVMTWFAMLAVNKLKSEGLRPKLFHFPSLKPIDKKLILKISREVGRIITVENHSIYGGLGSAVAEVVAETSPCIVKRLGIPDKFGETASFDWQLNHFGLSVKHITKAVKDMWP